EPDGEEKLVVVQEIENPERWNLAEIFDAVSQAIADQHELHAHAVVLIKPGTIPKTTSGKIQRHACRKRYLDGRLHEVGRSTPQEPIVEAAAEALTVESLFAEKVEDRRPILISYLQTEAARLLKTPSSGLDAEKPLTAYGIDSLMSAELKS